MTRARATKLFFDGGSRPDGMEIAVVLRGRAFVTDRLGPGSSTDAEWLALIAALRLARDTAIADAVLIGDCRPVIDQATGAVRPRGSGIGHFETFAALAAAGPRPRIRHVGRGQNLAGIALARRHIR